LEKEGLKKQKKTTKQQNNKTTKNKNKNNSCFSQLLPPVPCACSYL
jgi:hypothetical protein